MTLWQGGGMRTRWQSSWCLVGAAMTVVATCLACRKPAKEVLPPRPTPPPPFSAERVHSISLDSIRLYAATLQFDTTPGAFDERPVDFAGDRIGVGPEANIQPEVGSAVLDRAALAEGRIVARIRSDSAYAPAGFGPWWTYWWVSQKGDRLRSRFIRGDSAGKVGGVESDFVLQGPEYLEQHKVEYSGCPKSNGAACARFMRGSTGKDVTTCHQCGSGWCSGSVPTATQ